MKEPSISTDMCHAGNVSSLSVHAICTFNEVLEQADPEYICDIKWIFYVED